MKCPMNKKFLTDKKYEKEHKVLQEYGENIQYCVDKEEHIFKKIYEVDAKMNRIIIYPTSYYHQAIINQNIIMMKITLEMIDTHIQDLFILRI